MPDCIITSAGRSSRMTGWKPILPWSEGRSILETVVDTAITAGCRIILVGGYRYRYLKRFIRKRYNIESAKIVLVQARKWRVGMDMSIRKGLPEISTDRFFVLPVDMPLIRFEDLQRLAGWRTRTIVRPVHTGVPGHPVLFSANLIPTLLTADKGTPFREILKQVEVELVDWDNERVTIDIDTWEEYSKYRPEV